MFYFHPYLGKIPILTNIFQRGWNHQLDEFSMFLLFSFIEYNDPWILSNGILTTLRWDTGRLEFRSFF